MTRDEKGTATHGFWRRAYRALLPLLPEGLRARQGEAMVDLFDHELSRSEVNGTRAVWKAGVSGLADLVGRGVYERLSDERRALTPANRAILRSTAVAFIVTCAVLTVMLVARVAATRASVPFSGSMLDVVLLSIPYTAALTIPMAVFIAVLWAATRAPTAPVREHRRDDPSVHEGTLRFAPMISMAAVVALCCLALNAELVPRANLRLQAIYAGQSDVVPSDRSMTLSELRRAEASLTTASPGAAMSGTARALRMGYEVEIQKKLALAAACVVLAIFAAGIVRVAPRIRVWTLFMISGVVFSGYYVCLIAGEQLVDSAVISPAMAMWSANVLLLLIAMLMRRTRAGRYLVAR